MSDRWSEFYKVTEGREPREMFLMGFHEVPTDLPKKATEVGFGTGNEVLFLLDNGWEVHAIDKEEEAASILRSRVGANLEMLKVTTASFEDVKFGEASLIHAGYALPFCHPDNFDDVWSDMTRSLLPRGIFCGQLFGENDAWSDNESMTFQNRSDVESLLDGFDVITIEEREGLRETATGGEKYWHTFDIIARKS